MFWIVVRRRLLVSLVGMALLLPMLSLMLMAAGTPVGDADTLSHLLRTVLPDVIVQTGLLCVGVMLLTSSMGMLTAWWVTAVDFPGRRWIEWTLLLPMAMPSYVIAYAYTDALQFAGPVQTMLRVLFGAGRMLPEVRSLPGAIVVLSCVMYPYVYLMARTAFSERSPALLDAARSMGLNAAQAFWQVAMPVARPAWVAGLALVLMEVLAEYGALSYFGVQTLTTAIFKSWLNLGDRASAAFLAVLLLVSMLLLMLAETFARGRAQFYTQSGRSQQPRRQSVSGIRGMAVMFLCLMPPILGFFAPVLFLLRLLWESGEGLTVLRSPQFAVWVRHSVELGLLTAAVTLGLSLLLAYARRQDQGGLVRLVHQAVSLGYGIPGAIIAIAILIPLARIDRVLVDGLGLSAPLITGSVIALIYAYCVRFTSASLQAVDAGLARITPHIDDCARTLGCSARQVGWRIHVPMLRGSLATGALLVMVDVIKELPGTLVLRPFDFDTLAVITYQLASDERLAEAALPALCIVVVALIPMLLLIRQSSKQ